MPQIRKYKYKFRTEILCGALWGKIFTLCSSSSLRSICFVLLWVCIFMLIWRNWVKLWHFHSAVFCLCYFFRCQSPRWYRDWIVLVGPQREWQRWRLKECVTIKTFFLLVLSLIYGKSTVRVIFAVVDCDVVIFVTDVSCCCHCSHLPRQRSTEVSK